MELGMVITKVIVAVFIAFYYINIDHVHNSWMILFLLIYLCLNFALQLIKNAGFLLVLVLLSVLVSIWGFERINPLFLLLLPANIYECLYKYIKQKGLMFVIALIPILYIENDLKPLYFFSASFCFLIFTGSLYFSAREAVHQEKIDQMRRNIERLSQNIHEKNEFMRQSEYTSKLEERNRLSQEIHDQIGHSITGALIQMEASKHLIDLDKEKSKELLQNAINISKEGIEKIRLTLKNIKPPMEQMGVHRIKLLLDEFSSDSHMKTSFVHRGNIDLITPLQWKVIQENITEALTNTRKYSSADSVYVEIQVLNKLIKVDVKDNGKGSVKVIKGLGITGMEERAAAGNGQMIIDGTNGFSVTTLLPIV